MIFRTYGRAFSAATLTAVALAAGGCASNGASAPALPAPSQSSTPARGPIRPNACTSRSAKNVYVANFRDDDVLVFCNTYYAQVGAITSGVSGPSDVTLDENGNLYVANFNNGSAGSITEYAPGAFGAPSFTYSAGMQGPQTLAVDTAGHVFEGDQNNGNVNEYAQNVNSVLASCSLGGDVSGVAIDPSGNVFVRFFQSSSDHTFIAEYVGGLAGCHETVLPFTFTLNGGIALDRKRNLLVCDGNHVDVIDRPYTSISGTIGSGFNFAFGVSLNKKNSLAFVADYIANTVTVVNYPAGTNEAVITSASGLSEPFGAVDFPNAVY